MKFYLLASGSKGNATLITYQSTCILIDCGVSKTYLVNQLKQIGYSFDEIQNVLLTHDHSDHNRSIQIFNQSLVYAGQGCLKHDMYTIIEDQQPFLLNDLKITPIALSHDATKTFGFIIQSEDQKLVYITDTGYLKSSYLPLIENADYYILESNHDIEMLMNSRRPYFLKRRILSDQGHLSNEDSAIIASRVIGEKTKHIVLAHLSEEANDEVVALQTWHQVLSKRNVKFDHILIETGKQFAIVTGGNQNI